MTTRKWEIPGRKMNKKNLAKYFIHGIAFSLLFLILSIAWGFGLLITYGSLGLIIGLGVLFVIIGEINITITSWLWFPVKEPSFWDVLKQGFILFIVLLIVDGIFVIVPSMVFPRIATVISFIYGSFLNGIVGKKVAEWWPNGGHRKGDEKMTLNKWVASIPLGIFTILVFAACLSVAMCAREPEVYADSSWQLEKGGNNLYKISIKATTGGLTPVRILVETNGRIIGVEPSQWPQPSRWEQLPSQWRTLNVGESSVTIKLLPAIFNSVRHLQITVWVDKITDKVHYNITVWTLSGSVRGGF